MKKRFYASVLAMLLCMTCTTAWADVVHISTAEELRNVAQDNTDYVLDNDIDLEGNMPRKWHYSGTFDGNGHTIYNVPNTGLFSAPDGGAVFKNLTIDNTSTLAVDNGFASFAAFSRGSITFENCVNKVNMSSDGRHMVGGFIGEAHGAGSTVTFINCRNEGEITGSLWETGGFIGLDAEGVNVTFTGCMNLGDVKSNSSYGIGGFIGQAHSSGTYTFTNCGNMGTILCGSGYDEACAFVGRSSGTIALTNCWNSGQTGKYENDWQNYPLTQNGLGTFTNCYDVYNGSAGVTQIAATDVAGGALCYLLNGDQSTIAFYQTLGTDQYPVLDSTHGQVYRVGQFQCDGITPKEGVEASYTNTAGTSTKDDHNFVDGLCSVCGTYDPADIVDGVYHIGTAAQLTAFRTKASTTSGALLTANINMDGQGWVAMTGYAGIFDGGGFTISNLGNAALFNTTTGTATIKNLTITGGTRAMNSDDGNGVFVNRCQGNLTIQNCVNETPLTGDGYNWHAGGYVGQIDVADVTVDIIDCVNKADVTVENIRGGWGHQIGGFVGYLTTTGAKLNFTRCQNLGNVTNTSGSNTGGFLGKSDGNNNNVTFTNCTNSGTITASGTQTGGLLGFIAGSSASVVFTNCMNTGAVSSTSWSVGGIAGQSNTAAISFVSCGNTGKITGKTDEDAIEACPLIGNFWNCSPTANNCWNIAETQGSVSSLPLIKNGGGTCTNCYDKYNDTPNGVTLITDEQVTSGELCFLLNDGAGSTIFYQNIDNDQPADAYPLLDNTHGQVYRIGQFQCDGVTPKTGVTPSYSNTEGTNVVDDHNFVDGICSVCGTYDPSLIVDGVYQIATAAQLRWFSDFVNAGNSSANAAMTADIDLENVAFTPIGLFADDTSAGGQRIQYRGTFDGQGHVISNLTINDEKKHETGLFSRLAWGGNAVVKNLGVVNATITSTHPSGRAGVIAGITGASCTIENCFVTGDVTVTVPESKTEFGGITGGGSAGTIKNCWTSYERVGGGGTQTNCFGGVTAEEMASGALCYNINKGAGSNIFFQNIDNDQPADAYPVLSNTHGIVYVASNLKCDGVTPESETFSNTEITPTVADHSFVADNTHPVCTVCGVINETYEIALTDGFYQLGTANDLVWYSAYINQKNNEANAALTADIDMITVENFTPIGLFADDTSLGGQRIQYRGTFEGNGHVISNLTINDTKHHEAGLFSRVPDVATIQNLGIENANISCTNGANRCGVLIGWMGQPIIKNVYAVGSFSLSVNGEPKASTALVAEAWAASKVSNCWTVCDAITANRGNGTNGYAGVTRKQMRSGELCYNLNQGAGETVYYETIGSDTYPILDSTHGRVSKMSAAGYATFYDAEQAGTFSSGVTVFTGKKGSNFITLTEQQNTIPAATAVVLKGAEGYFSFTPAESAPAIEGENDFLGTAEPLETTGNEYVLALPEGEEVGFYLATGTIPAGKAYMTSASGVKGFIFVEDDATGIEGIKNADDATEIYNVAGMRLGKMQKGINIVGGKKILK